MGTTRCRVSGGAMLFLKRGRSTNFEQRSALESKALWSFLARSTKAGPNQKRGLDQAVSSRSHEESSSAMRTFCCGVLLVRGLACISRKTHGTSPLRRARHAIAFPCIVRNRRCVCCSLPSSTLRQMIRVTHRKQTWSLPTDEMPYSANRSRDRTSPAEWVGGSGTGKSIRRDRLARAIRAHRGQLPCSICPVQVLRVSHQLVAKAGWPPVARDQRSTIPAPI